MDEDFLDVTKSGNKTIAFILVLIVLLISAFGYFFVFQKYHFSLKTISLEIGEELSDNINDYLKGNFVDVSGYKLDTSKVNKDVIGKYYYKVTYNKIVKKGIIKVVDTKPPIYEVKNQIIEEGDEDFYMSDFLSLCEDASLPCLVSFKDEKDEEKLNVPGDYTLNIIVSDIYNNKSETTVNLKVVKKGELIKDEEKDLEFTTSSSDLPNFKEEYYYKFDKALKDDSEELKALISGIDSEELEKYVANNYQGYKIKTAEIVKMFNSSNYVIGIVIKITISNGTEKIIYVEK